MGWRALSIAEDGPVDPLMRIVGSHWSGGVFSGSGTPRGTGARITYSRIDRVAPFDKIPPRDRLKAMAIA